MNKMEMVHEIRAAKRAHVSWVSHAHALIEGLPLEQNQVPLNATECKFGAWFYGPGQIFLEMPEFKAIESPHLALHETYARIFKLLFDHPQGQRVSFFARLFGTRSETNDLHRDEARNLFVTLKGQSDVVVARLEALERIVLDLPDAKFELLLSYA